MERELARKLVHFVNDPYTREAYEEYASFRISVLKDQFVNTRTFEEVCALQGAIRELSRFISLREEVLSKKDL